MRIYVDTREKPQVIRTILKTFERAGLEVVRKKLDEGDYKLDPDAPLTIDRKRDLLEVCVNLCGDKDRFQRELRRAMIKGERVVILVEHGCGIKSLEDVRKWRNPRLQTSPYALSGENLYRRMRGYAARYKISWCFCDKRSTGKEIMRILGIKP